ncbi:MAG: hypothetical protein KAU94_09310 [Verrucomicrobia bacterium]|nr:hypothetical protein [Verrucomicrobiota bacterium]
MNTIIVGSILFVLTAGLVCADTHYVDIKSSSPKAPYTSWETAANRIHDAVKVARTGDTVLIGDGTYDIASTIVITRGLTVRSMNGRGSTTVNANRNCRVFFLKSSKGSITLEGLTITGGYTSNKRWAHGGGIAANGSETILISKCIVENNEAKEWGGGIIVSAGKGGCVSAIIANCIVRSNRSGGTGGGIHAVMWKDAAGSITIENCLIHNNHIGEGGGGGVGNHAREDHEGIKVVNCTITKNHAPVGGGAIRVDVYNSIIVNNSSEGGTPDIGEGCRVFNSCSSMPSRSTTGNIRKKPQFVNAKKGDFRLLPGSPCIDAGQNRHTTQSTDIDDNPRIVDGNRDGDAVVDMGAYEFQVIAVEIDIKPGSKSNSINLKSRGLLPVAILTTKTFDAASVNPSSLQFADAKPERRMLHDVDADGDVDLLLQFKRQKLNLTADSTKAFLTGQTRDKHPFIGMAEIKVVPPK